MNIEEHPRLLPGAITITWNHVGNSPAFKIMLTVIGNGEPCYQPDMFACFAIG